jgi:hypothetical protein
VIANGSLKSFRELPKLLAEARRFGTDIIYLWDYWQGAVQGSDPAYWNKGDYIPRADLGGEPALIDGIRNVHEQGGRILLYVEPFIIYQYSEIASRSGADWGAQHPDGSPFSNYPRNIEMVAPFVPWQDYIVSIVQRLIRDYGADGIFLDSYAWQFVWPMKAVQEQRLYSPVEYANGVIRLTERVRNAVQAINAQAVVFGETTAGPIARHWDGGMSAYFGFGGIPTSPLTASPVRYGIPEIGWFSNGKNINELHQVFAAGHGLALCNANFGFMSDNADHIRRLVEIRRQYADALVRGRQTYQPQTTSNEVAAYHYVGDEHEMLTVVNTSESMSHMIDITLRGSDADTTWADLINNVIIPANGATLINRFISRWTY